MGIEERRNDSTSSDPVDNEVGEGSSRDAQDITGYADEPDASDGLTHHDNMEEIDVRARDHEVISSSKVFVTRLHGFDLHEGSIRLISKGFQLNCEVVNCYIE